MARPTHDDSGEDPDGVSNHEDDKPWGDEAPEASRRDSRRGQGRPWPKKGGAPPVRQAAFEEGDHVWIWGLHAASAAMANPKRVRREGLTTRNAAHRIGLDPDQLPERMRLVEPKDLDKRLPDGAVHQGIAVLVEPIEPLDLSDVVLKPEHPLVVLDQVTDPQNVGAIIRSAAAFGFSGVILQTRNAPALGGALAKAAAGALETIPEIRVVNLSRAISELREAGWNVVGLDGAADNPPIADAFAGYGPLAVVLGAEGAGLRPGVAAACSTLGRIPIHPGMEGLHVSNAAAVAFYEALRMRGNGSPG